MSRNDVPVSEERANLGYHTAYVKEAGESGKLGRVDVERTRRVWYW